MHGGMYILIYALLQTTDLFFLSVVLVDAAMDTHDLIGPIDVPATVQEPEQSWLFETPAEEDMYNRINVFCGYYSQLSLSFTDPSLLLMSKW